jgi:hypothetical protein
MLTGKFGFGMVSLGSLKWGLGLVLLVSLIVLPRTAIARLQRHDIGSSART